MNIKALLLNKQIMLALGLIVVAGAVLTYSTGAFFSSSATAQANVFTAGTLNLALAHSDGSPTPTSAFVPTLTVASWNFTNMAPGGTPSVSSVWLKNTGSVDGMHVGIAAANTETVGGYEKQVRITSLTLDGSNLLQGGAGATIGDYVAPTNCTVTVSGTKITDAITAANSGDVICVAPGDYNAGWEGVPQIAVNKSVTVVSTQGPSVTSAIPFDITASGVTLRGFDISGASATRGIVVHGGVSNVSVIDNHIHDIATALTAGANYQGIYLEGGVGATSNFTFSGNTVENIGNAANNGSNQAIYIGDSAHAGAISNVTVSNNVISNVLSLKGAYGFEFNEAGGVTGLQVMNNSISDLHGGWSHAVGLEGNTPGASVTLNDIHDLTPTVGDAVGVQVESNTGVASITINQNNFTPNVARGIQNTTGTAVNGQNNWWGDQDPSDQISGSVNTAGFLGGPVAGFINGTDQNSNGYADMQDLRLTPLVNATPGLNAGQQRQLVMAVQLDGPTTGNNFQGANLTSDLTFTLTQQ